MAQAAVREYWEWEPCGTSPWITGEIEGGSAEWFDAVERHRYQQEPHILEVARFKCGRGARLLEIGVGAGVDHVQWAKAGAVCHGVDLTDAAIRTTQAHLAVHGLKSDLKRADAESLPYPDASFDIVYSWGVIHHSEHPQRIVDEIHRVLRPDGKFIGMMYQRHSLVTYKLWVRYALLKGRPGHSLADVLARHMESEGTKAYQPAELRAMFGRFSVTSLRPIATVYDRKWLGPLGRFVPDFLGWNLAIEALK
ncbi:MAG: class I SAM-dependent methyltransferase [Chloroflexi bacterium]|nr:MAG: class I SAM-dependent methyltransferase [Deltaproteobacteria bacterium]TMD22804.1 MAG: class I SAM-dependent methyltransferase [Chloroflexota bacterium]